MPDELEQATPSMAAAPRYQPLVVVLVAVCGGMLLDRYLPIPTSLWWSVALVLLIAWLSAWRRGYPGLAACLLLVSIALTGAAWHHAAWHLFPSDELSRFAREESSPTCLQAVALRSPRRVPAPPPDPLRPMALGERSSLEVEVTSIRDGQTWRRVHGVARLFVQGHLLGVHAGDQLQIFGQFSRTSPPQNPGEFDFARHLRADRQLSVVRAQYPDCVTIVESGSSWGARRIVERIREQGRWLIWENITRRRNGLASAVLLGAREEVGGSQTEQFVVTGTVHLLVVSGLHVGILAAGLFFALRLGFLRRGTALALVALLVVAYAVVAGARPPVIRAAVLVVLVCLAAYTGRRRVGFNTLAAAALVVLALNPADLFRTGPQLSFLAMATFGFWHGRLSFLTKPDALDHLIARTRPWPVRAARQAMRWWWRLALASLAVWLVMMPLVMARFHLVSPVAVLLNVLLWVPITIGLLCGFGVLLFGWLLPPLGAVLGFICDLNLAFVEKSVALAREVPGSHFWVPGPADWWLAGFYGGLALLLAAGPLRPPRRWCLALLAAWIAVGFTAPPVNARPDDRLDCTFLGVGHGCSVVLELPGGQTMLYDAGSLGSGRRSARSIAAYLWSRGITRIDAVVLSHADADHYNALPELIRRFDVGVVYVSPLMFDPVLPAGNESHAEGPRRLRALLAAQGVPIRQIWRGDRLRTSSDVKIDVLHPPRLGVFGSDNANSIVLSIEYAGRRILLPGDLESPGLEDVLAEEPVPYDVLLAPHHGSRRSDPPEFAAWSTPRWVVISGGKQGDFDPVIETYRHAGAEVLLTAQVGAVRCIVWPHKGNEKGIQVELWRPNAPVVATKHLLSR